MATNTTNKTVTVGTTPLEICKEVLATQRKSAFIVNTSLLSQKVTLVVGNDASAGIGFVMSPGGYYAVSASGNSFPNHLAYQVSSNIAGATLSIQETIGSVEDIANPSVGGSISMSSGRVTADISGNVNIAPVGTSSAYTGLLSTSRTFSAGTTTDTVPASKVWIVRSATTCAAGTASTCYVTKGGVRKDLVGISAAATVGQSWNGEISLATGDSVSVTYDGTVTYYEIAA